MNSILIFFAALAVVVGGVLVLRLHAVIALLAGAFLVAVLTPHASVYQHEVRRSGSTVAQINSSSGAAVLRSGTGKKVIAGRQYIFRERSDTGNVETVGQATLSFDSAGAAENEVRLVPDDPAIQIQAGDIVLHHTQVSAARDTADQTIGERVARGFGGTCMRIGILIALAAIIGKCLLDSGAAQRIVNSIRRFFGDRQAPLAFVASGFVVGIPVFFDTVFYLLIPLGKALWARTGRNYLLYVLSIVIGATMAHSLVPPTPGPLFVASELGVSIGLMMLGGIAVGLAAVTAGYGYALLANRWWEIQLRDEDDSAAPSTSRIDEDPDLRLPPFWLAILPILLPVVLLGTKTLLDMHWSDVPVEQQPQWLQFVLPIARGLGDKNVALGLATVVALVMLGQTHRWSGTGTRDALQSALLSGGAIVLITAAGGALGHVLRQTDIATAIGHHVPTTGSGLALLLVAFTVTAIVRVAQGSATVAMITAVGIVAPIAAAAHLPYHPLYLALAIGCGSKPFPWMNDSGFWVVGRMSGMTETETLKTFSATLSIMGVVGFLATLIGAFLLPLV